MSYLPSFKDGVSVGNLPFALSAEISGIVRSQRAENAAYFWTIDDALVNPAKLLAVAKANGASGGQWTLTGAAGVDVEDVASATVGGQPYLYVADSGDNASVRATIQIFRVKEPVITGGNGTLAAGVDYETIVCNYPAAPAGELGTAPRDAETLLVDPDTGDMYLLTKRTTTVQCFRLLHAASYTGTQTLTYLGDISLLPTTVPANGNNGGRATGGDISPDGSEIVVKNYEKVYWWSRVKGTTSIYTAMTAAPTEIRAYVGGGRPSSHPNNEPQGEAICFGHDGVDLYTASEAVAAFGSSATAYPLFKYTRLAAQWTEASFQQGVSGYAGAEDTYIYSTAGNATQIRGAELTFVAADNDLVTPNSRYGLLKFNLAASGLAGRVVVGADLSIFLNTEGQTIMVHEMKTAWTAALSTYAAGGGGTALYTPSRQPRLDGIDAGATELIRFGNYDTLVTGVGGVGNIRLKLPLALVQQWIDGGGNQGLLFYNTDGDGMQFRSCEAVTPADRPLLTIRTIAGLPGVPTRAQLLALIASGQSVSYHTSTGDRLLKTAADVPADDATIAFDAGGVQTRHLAVKAERDKYRK